MLADINAPNVNKKRLALALTLGAYWGIPLL